ncbi:hypothetical protein BH23GEM4_BH23GEM4_02120 [soil metagenome]
MVSWNVGAERVLGYPESTAIDLPLEAFFAPSAREREDASRALRTAAERGRADLEGWRIRSDGSAIWATMVITALRADGGETIGFGVIVRDLTERKRIARDYEESRQRYRSLFEHHPDAVLAFDTDRQPHSANPAAVAMTGHSPAELETLPFAALLVPEERQRAEQCFARAAAGKPQWLESRLLHRSGRSVDVALTVVPIRVHGEVLGVYAIVEDVGDRKRAEAEREALLQRESEARRAAEAASVAKSDFLAVMSHELRTPLNSILGFCTLIADGDAGPVTPVQTHYLARLRSGADRLLRMFEEILAYARLERGEAELRLGEVDPASLLREEGERVRTLAAERGLELVVDAPPGSGRVITDAELLRQAVGTLVSNAVKFTPAGSVRLFVAPSRGTVRIGVADTGIGIAAEHRERIFEPFCQLASANTRAAEGAGLGLTLARRLARTLGSEVEVESEPGRGSVFTLELPREFPQRSNAAAGP